VLQQLTVMVMVSLGGQISALSVRICDVVLIPTNKMSNSRAIVNALIYFRLFAGIE